MSIVEFAEEILGHKLLSFQKEFLTKFYEAYASNKQLFYIPHRGDNKWMAFVLQYIVIAYYWNSGDNEVKENDNKASIISKGEGEL